MRISAGMAAAAAGLTIGAGSALGGDTTIAGSPMDYHITLPEGTGAINTANGIGGGTRLGVFGEDRDAPVGRENAERRAIVEFDLAGLVPEGDTVTAATFSVFLPDQNSGVPNLDLDLWGSTVGRSSLVAFDTPGAELEFDAASYVLVDSPFMEDITPLDYDMRFSTDVTAFIAARYTEFLADPSKRYVFFRLQVQPIGDNANAFYEFSGGESDLAEAPQLVVTVVPGAGTSVVAVMLWAAAAGRRRRRWG